MTQDNSNKQNNDNSCGGSSCGTCAHNKACAQNFKPNTIKNTIVVLSGKGGVGKSTIAVNLAMSLSLAGKKVGLLDIDIHGPSIPTMLNLTEAQIKSENNRLLPVEFGSLKVISIGFMLNHKDEPLIFRGPMKTTIIRQFLEDVDWGDLDYLIVDSPPGTGDEPLSICQLLKGEKTAVIVTTPQEVSAADVRKSINFCAKIGMPISGIIENMSGFVCTHCNKLSEIFGSTENGKKIANDFNLKFLGSIPIEKIISETGDSGSPFVQSFSKSEIAKKFQEITRSFL